MEINDYLTSMQKQNVTSVNYEDTKEKCLAIGISWNILYDNRDQFRKAVKNQLLPSLTILQTTGIVTMVLSLMHKPLNIQGENDNSAWTDYLLIMLIPGVDPKELWKQLQGMVETVAKVIPRSLLRVEILRPQNMPMAFPKIHLRHVMEYTLSKPEKKEKYYHEQYVFSGPIIQRFLEKGAVGSFIGLERTHYLVNTASIPEWDVIHITGFKWRWIIKILWVLFRNASAFHAIARKIGYKSAWDVVRSWDAKREKFLRVASQDTECTLLPLRGTPKFNNTIVETLL